MANSSKLQITPSTKVHHFVRTTFSGIFGFIALALILVSILVVWLDRTLTDTNTYVKTVAPLVTKPEVQDFVVDKASGALLDNKDAPVQDIASKLLTPEQMAGKTDEQLKAEITPIVKESLHNVIASPTFAALWKKNNQDIHAQLITQLKKDSPTIKLNFRAVITGTIDQLGTTKLGFAKDKFELPADAGEVTLEGKQLDNVRHGYNYFKKGMVAVLLLAALFAGLCVWVSVHHVKTARRIALLTGIFAALLASLLSATSLIKAEGADAVQTKFAVALVNGVTHDLRLSLIAIAVLGIGGAIASKVYDVKFAKRK